MDMSLSIGGRRLHCRVLGAGPAILFVHGFPLAGRLWEPVAAGLAGRCRCIVPDLRGHGASDPTRSATMRDYAGDLAWLLDELDESGPVVLAGMSMGGYVAFELIRRHPERVAALALVNTRAEADTPEAAQGRRETARKVRAEGSAVVADAMAEKLFGSAAPEALRREWRDVMAGTPPTGMAAALEAMASRPASFETLSGFEGPVLVVAGAEDRITSLSDAESMRDAATRSRLVVVPGAGHMAPVERPRDLLDAFELLLDEALGD